jgi:hypothetical protein
MNNDHTLALHSGILRYRYTYLCRRRSPPTALRPIPGAAMDRVVSILTVSFHYLRLLNSSLVALRLVISH